jgi:hypothetical protein
MNGMRTLLIAFVSAVSLQLTHAAPAPAPAPAPGAAGAPVDIKVSVAPVAVVAGSDASVTVELTPKPGIKMNKYPKLKLQVPAVPGLTAGAEQAIGNSGPPPADQMDSNYFHGAVDPLKVTLHVDPQAAKGKHDVPAKVSYFYCVASSGYCAPAKADVTIPVTVR